MYQKSGPRRGNARLGEGKRCGGGERNKLDHTEAVVLGGAWGGRDVVANSGFCVSREIWGGKVRNLGRAILFAFAGERGGGKC